MPDLLLSNTTSSNTTSLNSENYIFVEKLTVRIHVNMDFTVPPEGDPKRGVQKKGHLPVTLEVT